MEETENQTSGSSNNNISSSSSRSPPCSSVVAVVRTGHFYVLLMTIDWQYKASKWNKSPHKHNNLRYTSNLLKINIYEWKSQIYGKMMNQNLLHFDGRWRDDPASWGGLSQYNFVKICILLLSELVYSSTKPMTEVIVCESEPRCQEKHCDCERWVSVESGRCSREAARHPQHQAGFVCQG